MILIDAGRRDARAYDARLMFATQLAAHGYDVGIDDTTLPETRERTQIYDAAPFLVSVADVEISGVLIIGAEDIADDTITTLRGYTMAEGAVLAAVGRFASHQSQLGTQSRLAYALGREPVVVDLTQAQPAPLSVSAMSPLLASDPSTPPVSDALPRLFMYLPSETLEDPQTLPLLAAVSNMAGFRTSVICSGADKEQIKSSKYTSLSVFAYSEVSPSALAGHADIAAFFGHGIPGERMAALALDMMASGKVVVDCTETAAFAATGAPALRGPQVIGALPPYLEQTVLPNRTEIARTSTTSAWLRDQSVTRLAETLGLERSAARTTADAAPRVVFVPTNGNGLGHAQRCSQIARAMDSPGRAAFLAFPSCVEMLRQRGFPTVPLVSASHEHTEEFGNDVVNYLRHRRTVLPGDHLVFDGGYVFDSIFRTVIEKRLDATWIRRGLWRPGQIGQTQLDREKVFSQVIVPQEAFAELNTDYTFGDHIHRVGPVVQDGGAADTGETRAQLSKALEIEFDELVVTALGGGVAADRTPQIQRLCATLDRRERCLHLVIAWPNARISAGLQGWQNTRVATTRDALRLCRAADLVISAAGYNAFHEVLYHGVPSILMPQIAPYMDDQERRARAASDRGLAVTVLPHELMVLDREVHSLLDSDRGNKMRARMAETEMPERGTRAAAQLIEGRLR
ncbi:MAG: glycosyltransferase [Pseudomonadota bacterium]